MEVVDEAEEDVDVQEEEADPDQAAEVDSDPVFVNAEEEERRGAALQDEVAVEVEYDPVLNDETGGSAC